MSDTVTEAIENVLEHHGVKGQKWGVRRKASMAIAVGKTARLHANNRQIQRNIDAANRKFLPPKKQSVRNIKKLEASNERIKNGKIKVDDILSKKSTITITDILKAVHDVKTAS